MLRLVHVGLLALASASCTVAPLPEVVSDPPPFLPGSTTGSLAYDPVIGSYTPRTPLSSTAWRGTGVPVAPLPIPEPDEAQPPTDGSEQ